MEFTHVSVLPQECMDGLNIRPDGIYIDGTTGGGGHSLLIAQRLSTGRLICIDRDEDALKAAKQRLCEHSDKITFVKSNFEDIASAIADLNISAVDGILFDLGVSSYQLDEPSRGFSYMNDAPLDMRMDRQQILTAWDVVNGYEERELKRIISVYGEERFAGRIAGAIVRSRQAQPIETTTALADIIRGAMPAAARREKQHPAKRTFQAIRIEVNGELKAVEKAMVDSIDILAPEGRLAVISFHSLEDRIVKHALVNAAKGCTCPPEFPVCICGKKPRVKIVSKGAIEATEDEVNENPRSRSAKLRVGEKL